MSRAVSLTFGVTQAATAWSNSAGDSTGLTDDVTPTKNLDPTSGFSTIFTQNFAGFPTGAIATANWRTMWATTTIGAPTTYMSVQPATVDNGAHGNVLQCHFTAGEWSQGEKLFDEAVPGPLFGAGHEAGYIAYDLCFIPSVSPFPWTKGGKLPGLGGHNASITNAPTGGSPSPYGWSGRGMWITPSSYPSASISPNEAIGYFYSPIQTPSTYGANLRTRTSFRESFWHRVMFIYRMNTVHVDGVSWDADGTYEIWLDGVRLYSDTAAVFREYQAANVNQLVMHFFFGGNTSAWAPATDCAIQIDNMVIGVA